MREAERALLKARATRNEARAAFDERLSGLRGAVEQRSLPARAGDEALTRLRAAADQAGAIFGEYRWVAALTALGLAGWFLRRPLLRWGKAAVDRVRTGEPHGPWQRLREWTARKVEP